ncbi:lipopolysaccharide biosynthesis protein [Methylomonas sp. LL1]|nr:lipopolysaccharide biosynthesis protein [Methylomonas sp. LL1]
MNPNFSVHPNNLNSLMLFGLSLGNYALMYWANIFLARHLAIDEFDDYSVAISLVTLLSTLATLGLEKYALRGIALCIERENWPRLRGFLRFSIRAILLFSLLLMGIISLGLESFLAWQQADFHIAIAVYTGFLPVIALCLFLIEAITVYGQQILALALYRFFLPALFLLLVISLNDLRIAVTAVSAVLCFGIAWCLTLLLMWITAHAASPSELRHAKTDTYRRRVWLKKSLPLLASSLMMTVLSSAGTIVLEILYPSQAVVGIYAVAMQTTALISLIGTSTNRYYLPMLVVLLERQDRQAIKMLLIKRLQLITGFVAVFLTMISIWGREILDLFGPAFSQGYWVLLITAVGTAFMTLFSDSLYYLQFMGRNRTVVSLMSFFALSMLVLSFNLGALYGATGVAIAYAAPTTLLFCSLKWLASRHMRQYLALNAPT